MKYIIDYYKQLDTINLFLFWGIIIVILLLLVFAIIIVNKNKRLKRIIASKSQEIEESKNELAIKNEQLNIIENNKIIEKEDVDLFDEEETPSIIINENIELHNEEIIPVTKEEIKLPKEENDFIAEEHVIEYNNNTNIKNEVPVEEEKLKTEKKEIEISRVPYQKNVLREMSLSQTSPIGIIRKESIKNDELSNAKELHDTLNYSEEYPKKEVYENNYQKEMINSKEMINKLYENNNTKIDITPSLKEEKKEGNTEYLKEVSQKLSEAKNIDGIERTEYEIKQEEEAIISYEELMQKKDSIQMIDEEEAIISIDELYERNKQKDKLYNITKDEDNDEFISELKHFRSDL